jgi:hypothetical protein
MDNFRLKEANFKPFETMLFPLKSVKILFSPSFSMRRFYLEHC